MSCQAHVCALKVADEHFPEICPAADGVGGQELQPGADVLSQAYWMILDDKAVVACSSGPTCKPVVLQPHAGVRIPSIFYNVRRWLKAFGGKVPHESPWKRRLVRWGSGSDSGRGPRRGCRGIPLAGAVSAPGWARMPAHLLLARPHGRRRRGALPAAGLGSCCTRRSWG